MVGNRITRYELNYKRYHSLVSTTNEDRIDLFPTLVKFVETNGSNVGDSCCIYSSLSYVF